MCEKIGNGFKWKLKYLGFQIYLSLNILVTIKVKTLNFNAMVKVFKRLDSENYFCLVSFQTWKLMCEKIGNWLKWELYIFCFQIYLRVNSLFIIGKTLKFNSLLKVFQRLDSNKFSISVKLTKRFIHSKKYKILINDTDFVPQAVESWKLCFHGVWNSHVCSKELKRCNAHPKS